MNVTREVIYDLLPAYFSDEVSADTRALVEEFFKTDPEFGRMAERFRSLHEDRLGDQAVSDTDTERETFDHVKTRVKRRQAAVMWGIGALMAFGMAILATVDGRSGFRHPGTIIGLVFAATAGLTWLSSRSSGAWTEALSAGEEGQTEPGRRKTRRARKHA